MKKAVLGLIKSTSEMNSILDRYNTPEKIAAILGLTDNMVGLVNQLLLDCVDEGIASVSDDGSYVLNDSYADTFPTRICKGWVFYSYYSNSVLDVLIIGDFKGFEEEIWYHRDNVSLSAPAETKPDIPSLKKAARCAASVGEFSVFSYPEMVRREERVLSISIIGNHFIDFPLVAPVEIRHRIAGDPGVFYYAPQVWYDADGLVHCPEIKHYLDKYHQNSLEEIRTRAQEMQLDYLQDNGAATDLIKRLGGRVEVNKRAREEMNHALFLYSKGKMMKDSFWSEGLQESLASAEVFWLMQKEGRGNLFPDITLRHNYAHVLQVAARIIGDDMAEYLKQDRFLKQKLIHLDAERKKSSEQQASKDWENRIEEMVLRRKRSLGFDLGEFKIERFLKRPGETLSLFNQNSSRHQLGNAFALWLVPAFLEYQSSPRESHMKWVANVFRIYPQFGTSLASMIELRNSDKTASPGRGEMSAEDFRTSLYMILVAIGCGVN